MCGSKFRDDSLDQTAVWTQTLQTLSSLTFSSTLSSFENVDRMRGLKPEEKRAADAEVWRGYVHLHIGLLNWSLLSEN